MDPEQPQIHRDDQLSGGVASYCQIKPISPRILQLAEAQIAKFHPWQSITAPRTATKPQRDVPKPFRFCTP
jgi:hypothetical protein